MSGAREALVVGGGLAGAALAIDLARGGRDVVLLERERGPHHKVCGEFLSHEALAYLHRLGLDLESLGAKPIDRVAMSRGRQAAETELPFAALSLSRRALDEALLNLAQAAGAEVRRGARAASLTPAAEGWVATLGEGETLPARTAFLATGKHDLRGHKRPPGGQDALVGFKLHWRLRPEADAALARRVELFLFPGGYGGLEPVEGGLANLCLLVHRRRFARLDHSWPRLLQAVRAACPLLDDRLYGAAAQWERPLAISGIPYGHLQKGSEGLWRVGDQAAVIPSFAGDGMAIALHSARLAANSFLAGEKPDAYQRRLASQVGRAVACATIISKAMTSPWLQPALTPAARLRPELMRSIARLTRIPALEASVGPAPGLAVAV